MNVRLKRGIWGILVLSSVLVAGNGFSGCDTLTSSVDDTEEPVRDNPGDANGTNPQPPKAEITSHETGQVIVVNNHSLSISWQPASDGVTEGVEYQYRLAGPNEEIGEQEWSSWSEESEISLTYLEESIDNSEYSFQVKSRSSTNTGLVQDTPTELNFIVDAVPGAGLIFRPRRIVPDGNGNYTTEVWLHGIEASHLLAGVKAVVTFDASAYQVQSVTAYEDENSILANSGGTLAAFTSQASGTIELNVGVLGGDLSQIQGSGRIATIQFTANEDGSPAEIVLDNTSKLKDIDGGDITISAFDAARLSN